MKRTIGQQKTGHIVRDYYIGNTHCVVCDDYCSGQTKEEAETILERIAANALRSINADNRGHEIA